MNRPESFVAPGAHQLALPLDPGECPGATDHVGVTFRDTLRQPVFGWYPYVEGFSAKYTLDAIRRHRPRDVYDPFAGSGTTQLAASCLGISSFYAEVNPFMRFVAETKVNSARWGRLHRVAFDRACTRYVAALTAPSFAAIARRQSLDAYERAFPERDFFEDKHIRDLLAAVQLARDFASSPEVRAILLLACAANAVLSSNMTRRADLRRRRPDEYKERVVNVPEQIASTVSRYVSEVDQIELLAPMTFVSADARKLSPQYDEAFDLALTSPPYLNGTNYFRNTKIELWLLGFMASERELAAFRRDAIAAGINNVTRTRTADHQFEQVEVIVERLQAAGGDMRIPLLVRQYCSDMHEMFVATRKALKRDGAFLLDIGDSKFYGVHVPTDALLIRVASEAGLVLRGQRTLARRYSRDKSELKQVELTFAPVPRRQRAARPTSTTISPRKHIQSRTIEARIVEFQKALPYQPPPYCKRNWGHPLHSLCSYQGKLKPALAHWLVRTFVRSGGRVLDPLGGVGTIAFEASLQGCEAVSNDLSPLAATVARAKLAPPSHAEFDTIARSLLRRMESTRLTSADKESAAFGLNGKVHDFFHPDTLTEVLKARRMFQSQDTWNAVETFFWACLLHVLHGNRPYALSRTSHPITPFHPTGPFTYKSVGSRVLARASTVLSSGLPEMFRAGVGLHGDFRDLRSSELGQFDAIITSPPFIGMRFDRPNWLRLWFCGWNETSFHTTSRGFLERQQLASRACYEPFFERMHDLLREDGLMILHIGSGGAKDLVGELRSLGRHHFRLLGEVVENVQAIEQHGIRDKGLTSHHHLVFFGRS